MIEVEELIIRTPKGKIHRVMMDSEGNLYAWKRCRLATANVAALTLGSELMEDADEDQLCKVCTV